MPLPTSGLLPAALSDGQLAATKTTLFTVSAPSLRASLTFLNAGVAAETVKLWVNRGTVDRQLTQFVLNPGESAKFVTGQLRSGHIVKASSTNAAAVDYDAIEADPREDSGLLVLDANGGAKFAPFTATGQSGVAAPAESVDGGGGIPLVFSKQIADAASGNVSIVMTRKVRVIDVWAVKEGGAGHASEDTVLVGKGASAITDAIALGAADKAIKRAATIDDANRDLAAGDSLRFTWVKGSGGGNNPACTVYVKVLPIL